MSTYWELECMDCGASTDWGQSVSTNHIEYLLGPLCESGGIHSLIAAALAFEQLISRLGPGAGSDVPEWSVSLHRSYYPGELNIELAREFRGCAGHRIWPRNEYDEWHPAAPTVVDSEPMANARSPADPNKTKPYWHTVRQPQTVKPSRHRAKPPLEPGYRVDGSALVPRSSSSEVAGDGPEKPISEN